MSEIKSYTDWKTLIVKKIRESQLRVSLNVNAELLQLYWSIGNSILHVQRSLGWGQKVIDKLSKDILKEFPDSKGFSVRNLKYMRAFAEAYPDFPIVQVPLAQSESEFVQVSLAQITWYHHITLLSKVKDLTERVFYIEETAKNGWSRDVMIFQIQNRLYERSGKAINNFQKTLPGYQSDLAKSILKDPYKFSFLTLTEKISEQDIEKSLIDRITDFLLELGRGFAFVGRQFPIEIDGDEYRIDLLFYHTILHCYVVIELKIGEFKPAYISKLNFYISAVDEIITTNNDNPTIGLLLCTSKSNIKVEYAMRGLMKPIGVAAYELEQFLKKSIAEINDSTE
jgi:predicted nuclease of restriction endonuclease-like (RecB) superfamily